MFNNFISLKNYKVLYNAETYRCISVRPFFEAIETEKTNNGDVVAKNRIIKSKWIECIVFDFDGSILLLSDEEHMFTFLKDKG